MNEPRSERTDAVHSGGERDEETRVLPARRLRIPALPTVLFFLSGATGLAYEVVWFKRFSHVWGNSTLAVAAVVASFLCGLGLGAALLGRLADRVRSPFLWYGFAEIGVGILALIVPFQIAWLLELSGSFYPFLEHFPAGRSLAKFILTFLVLGPPCILMGGTLPLVLRQFTRGRATLRESSGWLYGMNTLGAAVGCYATGFHLLPRLGLQAVNGVVAVLSLAIGTGAVVLSRRGGMFTGYPSEVEAVDVAPPEERDEPSPGSSPPRTGMSLYWIAGITGCAALILEIIWTRQLALILGSSTYAFTAMLSLFLLGIGLGGLAFHVVLARYRKLDRVAPLVILALVVSTLIGKWAVTPLTLGVGMLRPLRVSEFHNGVICLGASTVLELLPTVGMGLLLPLLIHLTHSHSSASGRAAGNVYAFNVVGSIVGAAGTSLFLIPAVGLSGSVAVALALYTVALIVLLPTPRRAREAAALFLCCMVAGGAILLSLRQEDPRITNLGMYLYGYLGKNMFDSEVVYFHEGASCNVLVTEQEHRRALRVNGKVDASDTGDMDMQVGSAYLPLFYRPESRDVLVIGHGSGTTCGATLLFPETRVTCCEIERGVFEASKHFSKVNHRPWESERFSLVLDDGRSFLQGTDHRFDLIISEPSNPWMAGLGNLFTREFYELTSSRLTPEGVFAQWIQCYSFSPADYALVARTLTSVFPESRLIRISDGDTVLLGSFSPLTLSEEHVTALQTRVDSLPEVEEDLRTYLGSADVRALLLRHVLLDSRGLQRLLANSTADTINTDINMRLEFDAPLSLFGESRKAADVPATILAAAGSSWFATFSRELGVTAKQAGAFHRLASLFDPERRRDLVQDLVDLGLSLDPAEPSLQADWLSLSADSDEATFRKTVAVLVERSPMDAARTAKALFQSKEFERAVIVLEEITRVHPSSSAAWTNLGVCYRSMGEGDRARSAFERAMSLDPLSEYSRSAYLHFESTAPAPDDAPSTDPEWRPTGFETP